MAQSRRKKKVKKKKTTARKKTTKKRTKKAAPKIIRDGTIPGEELKSPTGANPVTDLPRPASHNDSGADGQMELPIEDHVAEVNDSVCPPEPPVASGYNTEEFDPR